ncbi:hypothetical protein BM449_10875 [Synechococcus sp. SynAce01]|nr:hypothetical protein BM449_10875 [Synechococcus sp. SynAce01]
MPSPPPEPAFQQRGGFSAEQPALHRHGVVGAGVCRQVEAAAEPPTFGVGRGKQHGSHAGLDQGAGAHRARLQGHQQGAAVEAPVAAQQGRLAQGHQFGVPERVLAGLALVGSPAQATAAAIEHRRRHRDLAPFTGQRRQPQQSLHPELPPSRAELSGSEHGLEHAGARARSGWHFARVRSRFGQDSCRADQQNEIPIRPALGCDA